MATTARALWEETAWHLLFLPARASSSSARLERWGALLEALDGVGYDAVGDFLNSLESSSPDEKERRVDLSVALADALNAAVDVPRKVDIASASWPEAFKFACAAATTMPGSPSPAEAADPRVDTILAQLAAARGAGHTANAAQCPQETRSPACFHNTALLYDGLFVAIAAQGRARGDAAEASLATPLFTLMPPSDTAGTGFAEFERVWRDARLYAVLLMHQHHVCGRAASGGVDALARWLARYIHLHAAATEAPPAEAAYLSAHAPPSAPAPSPSGARTRTSDARAAACGVVAGILDYAMATTRALPRHRQALLQSWVRVSAAETGNGSGSRHDGVHGTHGACVVLEEEVQSMVAVLLAKLVASCQTYGAECYPTASGEGETVAVMCAMHVVHCVHELLFGLVYGGGTGAIPVRPTPSTTSSTDRSSSSSGAMTSVLTKMAALSLASPTTPLVVTARGLTLTEADAITQLLFPALLQQLGFEWPWSPLFRFLRQLGKHQRAPGVLTSVSPSAATDERGAEGPALTVAWSGQLVLETVLLALSRRTYPGRLHNLLPGSYMPLLTSLGLMPTAKSASPDDGDGVSLTGGDGLGGESPASALSLFDLPLYYQAAGQALIDHFAECEGPGGGGVRAAETEQVLARATASLPVIVQLRARRAATTASDENDVSSGVPGRPSGERGTLSAARVEALQCRYSAEVLLAAVIVHTQLQTPSRVQGLMRALSPLFSSLCARVQQAGGGSVSLLVPSVPEGSHAQSARAARLVFTREATTLIDEVGYQFYPLEWLPSMAEFYAQHQQSTTATAVLSSSAPLPYSLWAAVAHQLAVDMRVGAGVPDGLSAHASLPCGERSHVTLPSFSPSATGRPVRTSLWEYAEGNVAAMAVKQLQHDARAAAPSATWQRAERFFVVLMTTATFLSSRLSSCDLEGTLAVAVTRRLGNNHSNVGGALSLMPPSSSPVADRVRHFFGRSHILEQLYSGMTKAEKSEARANTAARSPTAGTKRVREEEEPTEEDATATTDEMTQLAKLLLRDGATSFTDVFLEARDFFLAVAGAFLPSTRVRTVAMQSCLRAAPLRPLGSRQAQPSTSSEGTGARTPSQWLLLAGWKWCTEAQLGGAATTDRLRVLQTLEQQLQSPQQPQASPLASRGQWWAALSTCFNSATVDAVPLARLVLRRAVARLVEKTVEQQHERHLVSCALHRGADAEDDVRGDRPDALLVHQWLECLDLLPLLGLGLGEGDVHTANVQSRATPWMWLWGSPFTSAMNGW